MHHYLTYPENQHTYAKRDFLHLIALWDTAGLLIDNHSKNTYDIYLVSVVQSLRNSFVTICSDNFAWSHCCGLLPADGSTGIRSAPARWWNSGTGQHGLVSCDSGWWEWLVRAEHSSGPWRIDVSWRTAKTVHRSVSWCLGFKNRCYSLLECHRQSYSILLSPTKLLLLIWNWLSVLKCRERTGPSW